MSTSRTSRPVCRASRSAERASSSGLGLLGRALVNGQLDVARDHAQLLPGGRTIDVDRNHERTVAVLRKPARQLAGGGGLARSLQPDDQHHGRRLVGHPQLGLVAAQRLDQLVADDLDHLLGGRQRGQHLFALRLFLDGFDELLDDAEMDVGFEQRHANLAQRGFHILGR